MEGLENQLRELTKTCADMSRRLEKIEATLGVKAASAPLVGAEPPARKVTPPLPLLGAERPRPVATPASGEAFNWLGFTGVGCFVLAAVYLIRLSIESGWLTPERQVLLTAVFGVLLVAIGELNLVRDRRYGSLLAGAGAVILHLSIYGAHFVHALLSAELAFFAVSAASSLSILLYLKNRFDFYIVTGILGTYAGFLALGGRVSDEGMVTLLLLTWNCVYAVMAVWQRERYVLHLASYFAFFVVAVRGAAFGAPDPGAVWTLIALQFLQFLIFAAGTIVFSVRHKSPLTADAAWSMFPLLLLFYASQYHWFGRLYPELVPWFGISIGALFLLAYQLVATKVSREKPLASAPMLFTLVGGIAFHAIFVELLGDSGKILAGWLGLLALPFLSRREAKNTEAFAGLGTIFFAFLAWANYIAFVEPGACLPRHGFAVSLVYGVTLLGIVLFATKNAEKENGAASRVGLLVLAHAHVLFGCVRLVNDLDLALGQRSLAVSLLWGVYAIAILSWAWKSRDLVLARSSLLILLLSALKVWILDLSRADRLASVLALVALGAVLYICGILYRRTREWA